MPNDTKPEYVRVSHVQDRYDISRATIYRWARKGTITIYKLGPISVLRVSDIEGLIQPAPAGA